MVLVVAGALLVVRFRRARDIERQQLRWVALATVLVALLTVVNLAALALGAYWLAPVVGGLNPPILSAPIGAAILRYRLYDLDRIISRAPAYGLLTVLLGGGYAVVVLGLGQLLGRDSSLVVAAATLTVAALFQPARRRIQAVVDVVSTDANTTPPRSSSRSPPACATRSTSIPSPPSSWRS
jgi:hypothetical protein